MGEPVPDSCEAADEAPTLGLTPGVAEVSSAIVRVARLHRILAGQLLRRVGLHPSQELVMMQLWEAGPQRQADLAKVLGTDAATMTRTIQRLEHGGFVRRTPSPTDKRSTIIEATPASMTIRNDVANVWNELEAGVAGDLTEPEQQQVLDLLGHMEQGLEHSLTRATTGH